MSDSARTEVAFTPYEISFCLHDVDRTRMWKEAIEDTVAPGDVVVDAGSGTGILGVFAALAGARKVYCIELHPRFSELIGHLAARNGLEDKIVVLQGDASKVELPEPADVLICELLSTGQFFEPQVQVVRHLRKSLKPGARMIPSQVRSYVRLLDGQEQLYGVRIDCDSRSLVLDDDEPVSSRVCYDEIDLATVEAEGVDREVEVVARKTRIADAVLVEGEAQLTPKLVTRPTRFLYNPEVIFLPRSLPLEQGRRYKIQVRYPYGGDTLQAVFEPRLVE
ncbi:MAG: 50S ribosomal protein L11 methyltransferase [Myxococcota bacterium]